MYRVLKRDGKVTDFKIDKIKDAITKAFKAEGKRTHDDVITTLALKTVAEFDSKIKDDLIEVEDIQDSVEKVLIESGFADVAKAFILYRKQRQTIRENQISFKDIIDSYIDDNRNDNSYSIGGLVFSNSFTVTSNYLFNDLFDEEIKNGFNKNYLYLHDLQLVSGHSFCLSAEDIKEKHKDLSINNFLIELFAELRALINEWSGPITLIALDKVLAEFVKDKKIDEKMLDDIISGFYRMINGPCGYKNSPLPLQIVIDPSVTELKKETELVSLKLLQLKTKELKWPTFTYIKDSYEMSPSFKEAFVKLIKNGSCPIIEKRKNGIEEKINYRQNYLKAYSGYGVDYHSGSLSLVSLNLVKIASESRNKTHLFEMLDKYIGVAVRELEIKKGISDTLFNEGLYPYTKTLVKNLNSFYLTVGVVGTVTMLDNISWSDVSFETDEGKQLLEEVLKHINDKLQEYQIKKKQLFGMLPLMNNKVVDYFVNKDSSSKNNISYSLKDNRKTYLSLNDYENDEYDIFDYLELNRRYDKYFKGNNILDIKVNKKDISVDTLDILIDKISLYDLKAVRISA